jgi:glycyl-tRNA synthetase beta chain
MPELLLELFSEEIPARMQARAADDLSRMISEVLAPLAPADLRSLYGPRRIALAAEVASSVPESRIAERGPRTSAPEQALTGFLRKHNASREQLVREGEHWVLHKVSPAQDAASVIASALPPVLRRFPWPKSMRWGGTSAFTWVRPLCRILCLLDGDVVRFDLRDGADDGHDLRSGSETEGHRFLAPGPVAAFGFADWRNKLRERYVVVDAAERRRVILDGVSALAREHGLQIVEDAGLVDEVAGLVEWPVALLGRIDDAFMDLPPEVVQVSMRVNQRYFALRNPDGSPAPWFAFVANIEAPDGGAAIVAGNERVLRARFSDARHFWDLDRRVPLESRVPALDGITFHAKLGSQGERVRRLVRLAGIVAPLVGAGVGSAERAALLAKADLTTGMVGEFPELQGVMGRYYALQDGERPEVADAIRDHYAPKGPSDSVPDKPVSIAVALADKLDLLAGFFGIGEKPGGSGDPYALRRAGLGIIRIVRENELALGLLPLIDAAAALQSAAPQPIEILDFLEERLRVQMRAEGKRHDVLDAVFAAEQDDSLVRLLARTAAVAKLLATDDGANLLTAYRRAANILRIESKKDGPFDAAPEPALYRMVEEQRLASALENAKIDMEAALADENYEEALSTLSMLRAPVDAFFDKVTVNAPEPELRRNRLRLLARLRDTMNRIADFSKIEG